jgi:hypothetical protein
VTATTLPRPAAPTSGLIPPPRQRKGRRRDRRWLRAVIPFAVVLALVFGSVIAYQVESPDQSNPDFLSPVSFADVGGARLAKLLADREGISVERVTHSSDALVSAYRGNATLFLPTPSLVHPYYLRMLKLLPASTTVVLAAPGSRELALGLLPVGVSDQRLATRVVPPGCRAGPAGVGDAGALRVVYTDADGPYAHTLYRCYGGGLVGVRHYATELDLVGSSDPFRNDRIGEHDNARLATALLATRPRVIWLDLHRPEPRPGLIADPSATAGAGAPPSLGPGTPDPDFPLAGTRDPGDQPQRATGGANGDADDQESPPNPLWSAFPPWTWATIVLLLAASLLLAFARGRRLGGPVAEPLPVAVPAAETVRGRGRLYQRAKARTPAIGTLRTAARERLTHLLDLPPDTPDAALADAVAARTGIPADEVLAVLTAPVDNDDIADPDAELVRYATALDTLVHTVARGPARGPGERGPDEGDFR